MQLTQRGIGPALPGKSGTVREFQKHHHDRTYYDDRSGMLVNGQYRLEKIVGRGGMGTVYLATDTKRNEAVAVKIRDGNTIRSVSPKRITSEIQALSQVRHRNVVSMKDAGTCGADSFIVMEYLEGMDLDRYIAQEGTVPYADAIPILAQICSGLGALHDKGIIHRDVKPHNVFLLRDGTVKIFDFDLSRFSGQEQAELHESRHGYIIGTPHYLPPEAFKGIRPDHRADIYAVGVIMYRMLCGALPIDCDEVAQIMGKILFENPAPPSARNPSLPQRADEIAMRALEKEPERRFQSMDEMRRELQSGAALFLKIPALRFGLGDIGPEDPTVRAGIITQPLLASSDWA
ncbi:serine/threonine protein kinase [Candidatus Micrarchaeota archaeon]|nr:serine/threonine protein kinase [Candidatus Micrarchaeota archaeon]